MTPSAVDTILILTHMSEYYQIDDDAPFTIERERLRLLTELLVSNCRVLMERLVDRRLALPKTEVFQEETFSLQNNNQNHGHYSLNF